MGCRRRVTPAELGPACWAALAWQSPCPTQVSTWGHTSDGESSHGYPVLGAADYPGQNLGEWGAPLHRALASLHLREDTHSPAPRILYRASSITSACLLHECYICIMPVTYLLHDLYMLSLWLLHTTCLLPDGYMYMPPSWLLHTYCVLYSLKHNLCHTLRHDHSHTLRQPSHSATPSSRLLPSHTPTLTLTHTCGPGSLFLVSHERPSWSRGQNPGPSAHGPRTTRHRQRQQRPQLNSPGLTLTWTNQFRIFTASWGKATKTIVNTEILRKTSLSCKTGIF